MEFNLAWLRLAASQEGTPERVLSELLRRSGVSTVIRGLEIDRTCLWGWLVARKIPDDYHARVCLLYESQIATDQRKGIGQIDVALAKQMRDDGDKLDVIAATFGVTKQAVHKALRPARRPSKQRGG